MAIATPDSGEPQRRDALREYGLGAIVVASAVGLAWLLREHVAEADLVMILMSAVVVVAFRVRLAAALVAAFACVAAFDFFFVEPYFTFAVADQRYLITFTVMAAVGVTISSLSAQARAQQAARRQAELRAEAERLHGAILSSVSHDLRTPMSTIVGAASTLAHAPEDMPAAARRDLAQAIHGEAERLSTILANLLELTRIEGGGLRLHREWHVPEEVVGAALARFGTRLGDREVRIELPNELTLVSFDAVAIETVLVNLIDNALRHTPEGTELAIVGSVASDAFAIEVRDRGPGIAVDERDRVFEKFQRGSTTVCSGTGLGLAIARAMVEAHGGRITCEDRRDGPGACFRIVLPDAVEAHAHAVPDAMPAEAAT